MINEDFPGLFGVTSRGVIAIHADWPTYPIEHGWQSAILALGAFPLGTEFQRIDDIDMCSLLLARGYGEYEDPYDERAFHVAIWHEDLLEAQEMGLIEGPERLTRREYEEQRREKLRQEILQADVKSGRESPPGDPLDHLGYIKDGEFIRVELPSLESFEEDDEFPDRSWLGVNPTGLVHLTEAGWSSLEELWPSVAAIPEVAKSRVDPILQSSLFDTALRELGVIIESKIREIIGSKAFGQRLIDEFIDHLYASKLFLNTELKVLRGDLRTAFKFVRNEFAHNVVDLERSRGYALVARLSHALQKVLQVAAHLEKVGTAE